MKIEKYEILKGGSFKMQESFTDDAGSLNKQEAKAKLEAIKEKLSVLQEQLYADNKYRVLIILQAMDAAGKDSAIEHVFSGINPQGFDVRSFKVPSAEEYAQDFLWRHAKAVPAKGRIGIHNRSHYENVLVCKVHPEFILNENLPDYSSVAQIDKKFWEDRYESIRNFEKHLHDNGTLIIKIFLNVSKEEQKERLLARIEEADKNWKFSFGDLKERALWPQYMQAYESAINHTSTKYAPWYVVPADKKWYSRLVIAEILLDKMEKLKLNFPQVSAEDLAKMEEAKLILNAD